MFGLDCIGIELSNGFSYFADQPLLAHPGITDRHLLVFAFEDYMKRWFFNTLQVLEVSCKNSGFDLTY
jgi:ribosome biogenesis protein MAK21